MSHDNIAFPAAAGLSVVLAPFLSLWPCRPRPSSTERGVGEGAPIAEPFPHTYRDVAVSGTFSGVDPQGEALTFRVTKNPARGSVTYGGRGLCPIRLHPYENKTGRICFPHVAVDQAGNVSQPAEVSVKIENPTEVTYADMAGHPAHKPITWPKRASSWGSRWGRLVLPP